MEITLSTKDQKEALAAIDSRLLGIFATPKSDPMETVHAEGYAIQTNWENKVIVTTPDNQIFSLFHQNAEAVIEALEDGFISAWSIIGIIEDLTGYEQNAIAA